MRGRETVRGSFAMDDGHGGQGWAYKGRQMGSSGDWNLARFWKKTYIALASS